MFTLLYTDCNWSAKEATKPISIKLKKMCAQLRREKIFFFFDFAWKKEKLIEILWPNKKKIGEKLIEIPTFISWTLNKNICFGGSGQIFY